MDSVTALTYIKEEPDPPTCPSWPRNCGHGAWKQGNPSYSTTSWRRRTSQQICEYRQGSIRSETESRSIQAKSTAVWSPGNRPVCIQNIHTASSILQQEIRPRSRSHKPSNIPGSNYYANPLWTILPRVLSHGEETECQHSPHITRVEAQVWYPVLLGLLVDHSHLLPVRKSTILQLHTVPLPVWGHEVQLAVYPISGDHVRRVSFLKKLQTSSWHHGHPSSRASTTHIHK